MSFGLDFGPKFAPTPHMGKIVRIDPKPPLKFWDVSWPSPSTHISKSKFPKLKAWAPLKVILNENRLRIVPKLSEASLTLLKARQYFFAVVSCSGVTALAKVVIKISWNWDHLLGNFRKYFAPHPFRHFIFGWRRLVHATRKLPSFNYIFRVNKSSFSTHYFPSCYANFRNQIKIVYYTVAYISSSKI